MVPQIPYGARLQGDGGSGLGGRSVHFEMRFQHFVKRPHIAALEDDPDKIVFISAVDEGGDFPHFP